MEQILRKYGFSNAKTRKVKPRLIISISGPEKCGKTHFSLTAPGPIALFSTDIGEEGVVGKFTDDKEIWVMDIGQPEEDNQAHAEDEIEIFSKAYLSLLRTNYVRTIVIDTATEIWELLRLARFGRTTQVMPYQYGPVNKEFRELLREPYKNDKNVILLHKMKEEYINDKSTGNIIRSGFKDTGYLVQINAQVYRYDDGEFGMEVHDCRQNPDLANTELDGGMCNFQTLASLALPEVDPEAWE
jgi:hypothetical protein